MSNAKTSGTNFLSFMSWMDSEDLLFEVDDCIWTSIKRVSSLHINKVFSR